MSDHPTTRTTAAAEIAQAEDELLMLVSAATQQLIRVVANLSMRFGGDPDTFEAAHETLRRQHNSVVALKERRAT